MLLQKLDQQAAFSKVVVLQMSEPQRLMHALIVVNVRNATHTQIGLSGSGKKGTILGKVFGGIRLHPQRPRGS